MLKEKIKQFEKLEITDELNLKMTLKELSELIIIKKKINESFDLLGGIAGGDINKRENIRKLNKAYDKLFEIKQILNKEVQKNGKQKKNFNRRRKRKDSRS